MNTTTNVTPLSIFN